MSCELIGTPTCPTKEAITTLRASVEDTAGIFSAQELRALICHNESEEARKTNCPIFQRHFQVGTKK